MESQNEIHDNTRSQINSVYQDIQAIYDAGTPIFTKDSIRKIGEELEHFQNGEHNNGAKITFRGINGVDYELFIEPQILGRGENDHVGGATWQINYKSIRSLTNCEDIEFFDFKKAYLPMRICNPIRRFGPGFKFKSPPTPPEEDFNMYQTIVQQWKTSQHFEQVQDVLASVEIPFAVTKVIGIGLGFLVAKSRVVERCVLQHALVSVLGQRFSISSSAFVQDPVYTQRDRNILHSAGLTVLEDPQGLLELDEHSILLTISADLPIKDIVADICRPGIIIWNSPFPDIRGLSDSSR
ncbi:hypothetical protein NPX13_g8288 [Xylaria arbuscula]|uniref:SRR1-like domain-containing protein n=1 Tax=Xylaria arbuscula TaxID=114810 RepID=A0A9W8N8Z1_9PEZI|nr:hypothetical protein NPX13_g8288 [Xylaria arbuscula]